MKLRSGAVTVLCLLALSTQLKADKVFLENGAVFEGKVISQDNKTVKIAINDTTTEDTGDSSIVMSFDRKRVKKIDLSGTPIIRNNIPVKPMQTEEPAVTEKKEPDTKKGTDKDEKSEEEQNTNATDDKKDSEEEEKITWDPEIDKLITSLNTKDENSLNAASSAILKFGKEASPALIKCLKEGSLEQKVKAAQLLGELNDKQAVEALIKALEHPYSLPSVSRQAWFSLKKITGRGFLFIHDATPLRRKKYVDNWKEWFTEAKENAEYKNQFTLDENTGEIITDAVMKDTTEKKTIKKKSGYYN